MDIPRHRWYFYKEGFSPLLVEKAIDIVGIKKDELILDPFNGSGTTTLTASLKGHKSYGIEVNPFTSFLASTKVLNSSVQELQKLKSTLMACVRKGSHSGLIGYSTFSKPGIKNKWLFNDNVLNSFEGGWKFAETVKSTSIKKLFQFALISSAMQNCNARRDGKCLRYDIDCETSTYGVDSFIDTLEAKLSIIAQDIQTNVITEFPEIINGDCRTFLNSSDNNLNKFKLCITSPPYLNTFDYTDIYRPELFLGKFIRTKEELYNHRLTTVRSHVQAKWQLPTKFDFGSIYDDNIKHIKSNIDSLMHKDIPLMVQAYFEDMYNILKSLKTNAQKDAQIWFVVSNSAYADKEIPVDLIIGDIGATAGWYLKEIGVLRHINKRKSKHSVNVKELRESVIIFSASK